MGFVTYQQFQDEVTAVVGARSDMVTNRIGKWVNFAYLDVTGAIEFEELEVLEPIIIGADGSGNLSARARAITALSGPIGLLQWIPKHEFLRVQGQTGTPNRWTRIGNAIRVIPSPNADTSFTGMVRIDPPDLSAPGDVTVLPNTWDVAIQYLAISHCFYAVGEDNRAVGWFNRAVAYIQTRAKEEHRRLVDPGLGGTLAPPTERLAAGRMGTVDGYSNS